MYAPHIKNKTTTTTTTTTPTFTSTSTTEKNGKKEHHDINVHTKSENLHTNMNDINGNSI